MISKHALAKFLKKSNAGRLANSELDQLKEEFAQNKRGSTDLYMLVNILALNGCREFESEFAQLALYSDEDDIRFISLLALMYHFNLCEKYAPYLQEILSRNYSTPDDYKLYNGLQICTWIFQAVSYTHLTLPTICSV